jgi:hypothetical protein
MQVQLNIFPLSPLTRLVVVSTSIGLACGLFGVVVWQQQKPISLSADVSVAPSLLDQPGFTRVPMRSSGRPGVVAGLATEAALLGTQSGQYNLGLLQAKNASLAAELSSLASASAASAAATLSATPKPTPEPLLDLHLDAVTLIDTSGTPPIDAMGSSRLYLTSGRALQVSIRNNGSIPAEKVKVEVTVNNRTTTWIKDRIDPNTVHHERILELPNAQQKNTVEVRISLPDGVAEKRGDNNYYKFEYEI